MLSRFYDLYNVFCVDYMYIDIIYGSDFFKEMPGLANKLNIGRESRQKCKLKPPRNTLKEQEQLVRQLFKSLI